MRSSDASNAEIAGCKHEDTSPMSIVLQAAEAHAEEVEGRHHDDATIAKSESIRVAVTRLRTPAKVDVRLLRQQRDWLLNLQADSPAELGRMVKTGAQYLDGIVNLLDTILDSEEGYAPPLQPVRYPVDHVYGLPGEPEAGEVVVLRWTTTYHVPDLFVDKRARFVRKTNRGLYVVALCSKPSRELRVRRHHFQRS